MRHLVKANGSQAVKVSGKRQGKEKENALQDIEKRFKIAGSLEAMIFNNERIDNLCGCLRE